MLLCCQVNLGKLDFTKVKNTQILLLGFCDNFLINLTIYIRNRSCFFF